MTNHEELRGWLSGRIPTDWFDAAPEVVVDREEITVIGSLATPAVAADAGDPERAAAARGRAKAFRESTREQRIEIASEIEHRTGRKVAWGVRIGEQTEMFTTLAVPVMARLRQPERQVLDLLVEAGVAKSRADALAWCVRLVGKNSNEWLGSLRSAMDDVARLRASGPSSS